MSFTSILKTRKKEVEISSFSVIMTNERGFLFLWSGLAYCLEDAIQLAAMHAENNIGNKGHWNILLHTKTTFEDLQNSFIQIIEQEKQKDNLRKNDIIAKIISSGDMELLKSNFGLLNEVEKQYIKDKLKEKISLL